MDLLQAVNGCLRAIKESPVNSLDSGVPDAESAETKVAEVTRQVLAAGWQFNTVYGRELTPNASNHIVIPVHYLEISQHDRRLRLAQRTDPNDSVRKLFNLQDETFVFTDTIKADIVLNFIFEDCPVHIQNYIAARAAREFQEDTIGSVSLDNFTVRGEQLAWGELIDTEAELEKYNELRDSTYMQYVTLRNNVISGR